MRMMAAITDPDLARRILACLKLPPRAPPIGGLRPVSVAAPGLFQSSCAPEVAPLQPEFDFDQSSRFDDGEDEGLP